MKAVEAEFDVEKQIREILSDGKETPSIFDRLLLRFQSYSNRQASTIGEINRRDHFNKKSKGNGWEKFCQFYLLKVCQFHRAWIWHEIPSEVHAHLKLGSYQDNGIDIVAQEREGQGFIAVQCKYRGDITKTVTWTQLSTFIALCSQTGPWLKQVVMTNCKGVSKKTGIKKTYQTIAYGTFSSLTRADYTKHGVGDLSQYQSLVKPTFDPSALLRGEPAITLGVTIPRTQEELRAARLARFNQIAKTKTEKK